MSSTTDIADASNVYGVMQRRHEWQDDRKGKECQK